LSSPYFQYEYYQDKTVDDARSPAAGEGRKRT